MGLRFATHLRGCTTTEAAKLLGVSPKTVRNLVDDGVLECWRLRTHRRFSYRELLRWAKLHDVPVSSRLAALAEQELSKAV